LARGSNDLTPKEANFIFVEQSKPAAATIETEGNIMSYPVIRLSEIRANPDLVLSNTDVVTRRLRNNAYTSELQELASFQQSINKLNSSFIKFDEIREISAKKLNQTLTQLEQWNNIYLANPPKTDETKDRYRRLQYNLTQRNQGIANLLRYMKKVADKRFEIDTITREIDDIVDIAEKEYANVEFALSE
jgi:DNA-binding HxlR family transcriptional regulator